MVERKTSVFDYEPPMVMARVVPGDDDLMQVVQATPLNPTGLSPQPTAPLALSPQPTAPVASITSPSAPYAPDLIEFSPQATVPVAPITTPSAPYAVDHQLQQVNRERNSLLDASSDDGTRTVMRNAGNSDENHCEQQISSCVAGGILGLLLGGPLGAILVGYGTVYYVDKDGAAGDISRAMGEIAISVRDKAGVLNEKHNIVEKSKVAAENAWEKAKQADREHHIVENTKQAISVGFQFIGKMTYLLLIKISQKVQEEQQRHQSETKNETRNFLEKSKIAAEDTWEKIKQADRDHHIVEITKHGLTIGFQFVVGAANFLFTTISQHFEENKQRRGASLTTRQ